MPEPGKQTGCFGFILIIKRRRTQAQVVWEAMIGEGETAVKQQMIQQLRDYCHLDTLAMVEIHRALIQA